MIRPLWRHAKHHTYPITYPILHDMPGYHDSYFELTSNRVTSRDRSGTDTYRDILCFQDQSRAFIVSDSSLEKPFIGSQHLTSRQFLMQRSRFPYNVLRRGTVFSIICTTSGLQSESLLYMSTRQISVLYVGYTDLWPFITRVGPISFMFRELDP